MTGCPENSEHQSRVTLAHQSQLAANIQRHPETNRFNSASVE